MLTAPVPPTEADRLATLRRYAILDSQTEEDFNDLVVLAAALCDTPIAAVSLVDGDRQWFKARQGLPAAETGRDVAFCAHTILGTEPMVVADATLDPRFADNPLVTGELSIRFYAGIPLINPEGPALGSLCVIDREPRVISRAQLAALNTLARQVVLLLELRRARDLAVAGAEAKAEFLATMSHEIRTPLNGVLGMTEVLLETSLSPEQRDALGTIRTCGDHLLTVINDVLDFSKLESGKVSLETVPLDLGELAAQVEAVCAAPARAKGLGFVIDIDGSLDGTRQRLGDPTRLRQALINFTSNAVKFTARGRITLRVRAGQGDPARVRFEVEDTGIGLTPAQIEGLFQRFTQADSSATRRFGGSGLGLAITRRIVELMQGEVGVASRPQEGSTFWLELPLATADARPAAPAPGDSTPVLTGLRVLVAEDNPVNQLLTKRHLGKLGCTVVMAANGVEAVAAFAAGVFDVILMDCQMPDMDGYEATRVLRGRGGAGAGVPIVALTASALDTDRDRCREAGMSDFLSKPFSPTDLAATLARAVGTPFAEVA